jgi:hypothetical protein
MGVRVFTDAAHLVPVGDSADRTPKGGFRMKGRITSSAHYFEAIYDGTAGQQGLPTTVPANECWIDISNLLQEGTNLGLTVQNMGTTTLDIYVSNGPREWANNGPTAAQVTYMSTRWKQIGTAVAAGDVVSTGQAVYSLMRIVFAANTPGSAVVLSN